MKASKKSAKKEGKVTQASDPAVAYLRKQDIPVWQAIPGLVNAISSLQYLNTKDVGAEYFTVLREISGLTDDTLSEILGMNVKTFRKYKTGDEDIRISVTEQEHVVTLLSLYKHGAEAIGSYEGFDEWIQKENFILNNKKPLEYLKTISGIQFIDGQLTAMEFGDVA